MISHAEILADTAVTNTSDWYWNRGFEVLVVKDARRAAVRDTRGPNGASVGNSRLLVRG